MKHVSGSNPFVFLIFLNMIAGVYQATSEANPINVSGSSRSILSPTIITKSGTYRLAQDIVGTLTIDADKVTVDLEHRVLTAGVNGIEIRDQEDVTIKNGIITSASTNGILISTCSNIEIFDVDFVSNVTGISVLTTTCVHIDNCTFRDHRSQGFSFFNVNNGLIENSKIIFNSVPGIALNVIDVSSDIVVTHLNVSNNTSSGALELLQISDSFDITVKESQVNENTAVNDLNAIHSDTNKKFCCASCSILDNVSQDVFNGVFLDTDTNSTVFDCLIKDNMGGAGGADRSRGIFVSSSFQCFVQRNILKDNISAGGSRGIEETGGANNVYFTNLAQGHGLLGATNYVGVVGPTTAFNPVTGAFAVIPTPFDNISVSLP